MKVGRRQFLQFMGLATVGLAVDPIAVIIRSGNYYINKKLGFGFIMPNSWNIEAFQNFDHLTEKQIIPELEGHSRKELVSDLSDGLVAVLHKYPNLGEPKFSPGITFFMASNEELDEYESLEEFVNAAVSGFQVVLNDYEINEPPELIKGKNFEAFRFKASFQFEAEGMEPTMVDDETLIVNHDGILYTIHLYDSPYTNEGCFGELNDFKASLHIA